MKTQLSNLLSVLQFKPTINPLVLLKIEAYKLFRSSNFVLFFLFLTFFMPSFSSIARIARMSGLSEPDFFSGYYASICAGALLLMALFGVNSAGKEFNEGSYRRALALGYSKTDFFLGKLQAISIFGLLIISFTFVMFVLIGLFEPSNPYYFQLSRIPFLSLGFKLFALFYAGILGFTFINSFRNTSFGLVFFPVLMFTEITLHIMARLENNLGSFVNYMPGTIGWHLFNANTFNPKAFGLVALYSIVLVVVGYWVLMIKEEKSG